MGLALIIVILKSAALRTADAHYDRAAGFWGRILAINFAMGVVTGIPLEFQFGTNWSRFSRGAGGVFYESPTDVHSVSRNASETQPAKLLVFYVKAKGAPPTVLLGEGER